MSFERSFLNFVRAKASFSEEFGEESRNSLKNDGNQGTLTGTEAKAFYRSVITTPSNVTERSRKGPYCKTKEHESVNHEETRVVASKRTRTHSSSLSERKTRKAAKDRRPEKIPSEENDKGSSFLTSRLVNKFLHYAQEGQLRDLKKLLSERNIDVNVTDQFSWTALMCAAHNGHTNVVSYLLDKGALWKGVVNSQGKTALDLAREARYSTIVKLLQEIEQNRVEPKCHTPGSAVVKPFWCVICEQEFTEDEKKHRSSTLHQFNCRHKPKGPYFSIPEDNPGYRLMVKSGWMRKEVQYAFCLQNVWAQ